MSTSARWHRHAGAAASVPVSLGQGTLLQGSLNPKVLWRVFRSQHLGFQLACLYIVFEYVRPQTRFPAVDVLPWTMLIILVGIAAMLPELGRRGMTRTPVNSALLAYFIVAAVSLSFAEFPAYGLQRWDSLVPWLVIYLLLTSTVTTRDRFILLLFVYVLCNLRLSQFGLRTLVLTGGLPGYGFAGPVGFFQNPGELGMQMAVFAPVALALSIGLWEKFGRFGKSLLILLPLSVVVTGVGTNSRGTIIAMGISIVWAALAAGFRLRNFAVLGLLLVIGYFLIGDHVWERFEAVGTDETSVRRITFIEDGMQMIADHPVIGIGYFNWMPYYTTHFPPVDDIAYFGTHQLPHNILIQVTAELGFVGLGVFLLLVWLTFRSNRQTRRMLGPDQRFLRLMAHALDAALVAFLIGGQFVTVLYYPYFWINLVFAVALRESCRHDLLGTGKGIGAPRRGRADSEVGRTSAPSLHSMPGATWSGTRAPASGDTRET